MMLNTQSTTQTSQNIPKVSDQQVAFEYQSGTGYVNCKLVEFVSPLQAVQNGDAGYTQAYEF